MSLKNTEGNSMLDCETNEEYVSDFQFNFINMPWDDRSNRSKFGIVALLFSIFVTIMACVINNFIIHSKDFSTIKLSKTIERSCHFAQIDKYPYVVRIYSATNQLLCIGALVEEHLVVANEACVRYGPIRIYAGSMLDPQCKRPFTADIVESLSLNVSFKDVTSKLALITVHQLIDECADVIEIGTTVNETQAHVIGRPVNEDRSLPRQPVINTPAGDACPCVDRGKKNSFFCMTTLVRCPIRAGDLLIQYGKLIGIASTSSYGAKSFKPTCFANASTVLKLNETELLTRELLHLKEHYGISDSDY